MEKHFIVGEGAVLQLCVCTESPPPKQYTLFCIASSSHVSLYYFCVRVCVCFLLVSLLVCERARMVRKSEHCWIHPLVLVCDYIMDLSGKDERLHSPKIAHLPEEKFSK